MGKGQNSKVKVALNGPILYWRRVLISFNCSSRLRHLTCLENDVFERTGYNSNICALGFGFYSKRFQTIDFGQKSPRSARTGDEQRGLDRFIRVVYG